MAASKQKIKDSQIKNSIRWHILRLLRLKSRTREELINKLNDLYLGYWPVNGELIEANLDQLRKEGLISYSDKYEITEKGIGSLVAREREFQRHSRKLFSKEACANYSLWGNVGLSALEFAIGFLSGSIGLIADAVHTAVDILASAITWIGIKINKEAQAGVIGGIVLFGIGGFIIYESITKIFESAAITFQAVALATIIVNIGVNGLFSYYKFYVGGRTRSIALVADAYHTKTDIWSSVAVLVGLLGATMGFFMLDAIAGMVVSLFILYGGYELISESIKVMQGEDPKLEKFSGFLGSHLEVLPDRGTFVSLWLLNLQEMKKGEHLEHMKKGFGMRFPIGLEDKDYESIYTKLDEDGLIESHQDRLRLTEVGRKELERLAEMATSYIGALKPKFLNARKINWFAEGL